MSGASTGGPDAELGHRQGVEMEVEQAVFKVIAAQISASAEQLSRETSLDELSIESLDAIEIIFKIEEALDIEIPYTPGADVPDFTTVGDIVDAVERQIAAQTVEA